MMKMDLSRLNLEEVIETFESIEFKILVSKYEIKRCVEIVDEAIHKLYSSPANTISKYVRVKISEAERFIKRFGEDEDYQLSEKDLKICTYVCQRAIALIRRT